MNWLSRFMLANWSYVFDALFLTLALLCGVQFGESRVQKAWDAEKQKIAQVEAKQEQHVADVQQSQSQITQEISHEFAKRSSLLADRQLDARIGGMRDIAKTSGRDMSTVSEATTRVAPTRSDPLSASQGDAGDVSCEQLSRDAAQTTLMLSELQRWYVLQSEAFK